MTLGEPRFHHWGTAVCVAVSADGKLASGGSDHVIRFWDVRTGQETAALRGHTSLILSLAFSPDGTLLASGSMDHSVRLWDVASGREIACFKDHAKEVHAVAFSPDRATLASGGANRYIKLWDLNKLQGRATLPVSGVVRSLSFSSDGKLLAAAVAIGNVSPAHEVKVFDARAGSTSPGFNFTYQNCSQVVVAFSPTRPTVLAIGLSQTLAGAPRGVVALEQLGNRKESINFNETGGIQSLAFLPDGEALAVALADALKLYSVTGKPEPRSSYALRAIRGLAAFADNKTLVTGHADCALRFWDADKTLRPRAPPSLASPWRNLAVAADGQSVAGASEIDSFVRYWDLKTGKELWTARGPEGGVQALSISPDGKHVLAGGVTGLMTFQSAGGQRMGAINDETWSSVVALSPDGSLAALLNQPQGITLHECPSCKLLHTLVGHPKGAAQAVFSPDGKSLASVGHEGSLRFWDTAARTTRFTVGGIPAFASALTYSPDGTVLAAAFSPQGPNGPGEVRLWNAGTGKESARTTEPGGLLFGLLTAPEGKSVIYSNKNGLKVWDIATGQKWTPPELGADRPTAVALSPDGRTLAAARSSRLLLWNLGDRTVQLDTTLPGPIHGLTFTPDGQRLLTANGNGTLYIYRVGQK